MPRANRSTVPDYVWHIAPRRHKREFRLRAKADRAIWRRWLWRSTSRYGLGVLNFVASSNRIDLLVYDAFAGETIARGLQQTRDCQSELESCSEKYFSQNQKSVFSLFATKDTIRAVLFGQNYNLRTTSFLLINQ